jgi:hypothetical protein
MNATLSRMACSQRARNLSFDRTANDADSETARLRLSPRTATPVRAIETRPNSMQDKTTEMENGNAFPSAQWVANPPKLRSTETGQRRLTAVPLVGCAVETGVRRAYAYPLDFFWCAGGASGSFSSDSLITRCSCCRTMRSSSE